MAKSHTHTKISGEFSANFWGKLSLSSAYVIENKELVVKITRRQLSSIIREGVTADLKEEVDVRKLALYSPLIALYVLGGQKLSGAASELYNSPEFADTKKALEALKVAARALPEAAKKDLEKTIVEMINSFLEGLKIKPSLGPEPGESELDVRDAMTDPLESPIFADDIEAASTGS